jgi:hypothetical protein
MKKALVMIAACLPILLLIAFTNQPSRSPWGLSVGSPEIKSMNVLAFGPDGILFIGDSKNATVFAVDTKDVEKAENPSAVEIKNIDQKIAAALGTDAAKITIQDMAVNPISKRLYCSVQSSDGTSVLLKLVGTDIKAVSLKDVGFSSVLINNAPSEEAKDRRGGPLRAWTISDLIFADGSVMVSGLSNQEFGSTFRVIPFPFSNKQDQSSLEIYHAAHGQYETNSPINTFTTAELNGKKFLVASYTCTPLVLFPLAELQPGKHVKGRTVGEFGAGNRPLDMITMKKGDDTFLIMANSERPVMKVNYKDIAAYQGSLTEQVKIPFSTAGVPYISFPMTNVTQLDKLDDSHYVYIQRRSNGDLDLKTASNEWF